MEYRDDDRWLFGPDPEVARGWKFVVALACLVTAGIILNGCADYADAANTARDEAIAHEKKLALMGRICATWVCQKSHDHHPCGPMHGYSGCVPSADYMTRTK